MDIQRSAQPDGSASAFLVERYLPRSGVDELVPSVSRVARICTAHDAHGTIVRYLQSIYLPGEDICFCVFQAPSSDAVRAVNDAGGFPLDRVSAAVLIIPGGLPELSPGRGPGARRAPERHGPATSA